MAEPDHPSDSDLSAFLLARDDKDSREAVRMHLEAGCVRCLLELHRRAAEVRSLERRALAGLPAGAARPEPEARRRRLLAVVERQLVLLQAERVAAPGLLHELLRIGRGEERREAIRSTRRFQLFGLAELLTEEARRVCFEDVAQAVALGRLAVEVADALDGRIYPPGLVVDSLALAWAALGNALRARADLVEAERALEQARSLLDRGSHDRSARAEVLSLLGSLRTTQARFDDAVEVLEEAAEIHRSDGDAELQGKVLVKLGNAAGERGEVERAVALLYQARERLAGAPPAEDLRLIADQSLAAWLQQAGRLPDARRVLEEIEVAARKRPLTFFLRQRVDWARARQAWLEGDEAAAERALQEVRGRFGEREEVYRMCLVTLDLAVLHLEQGRTAEARRLAREMLPVFSSRQFHHNALQALVVFHQAAEAESATVALAKDVARYLRRAHHNPYLPYEPTGEPAS